MRESIVAVLCCMASYVGFAQINSGNPAIPFGSRTAYSNGIMPTNLPSGGTYKASQDAADAYTAWKSTFVSACTNGESRVLYDDNSSTVSEGIGYGMLLSAYAGDKTTFDALWKFYKSHSNGNGVMNWKYSNCNSSSGQNGATDAEEDAAMALIIAEEQWPTASSPYDYKSEATTLISKIRQYEIHPSSYQTINGDAWGFNNSCRNPSYFAPAYYREYGKIETNNSSFWNSTISAAQSFLTKNRNSTTGLVSNWADDQAATSGCGGPVDFGWDAIRTPWRMATDVLWNGASSATAGDDICSKMSAWAKNDPTNLKGPVSLTSSGPGSGQYKNGTFGMIGLAFMAGGSSYQSALNSAYTSIVGLGNSEGYFSRTLRCITLFVMTGNFWKPGATIAPPPTGTATITPATATTFCSGGSVILNANTGNGYSYQWKKDNNNINNATSASYTANASGSYTVVVTANNVSATSTATTVTVNALPTANAGADVSICNGKSTTLTATGGTSYVWSTNATSASITVSPTTNTTFTVTVSDANKCSSSDAVIVSVNQVPAAPTVTSPINYSFGATATALNAGGANLQWYTTATAGSALSSAPVPSTLTAGTVSYYVSQSQSSCESERAKIDVVVSAQVIKIPLKAGWNLVGCPMTGATAIDKALNSIWSEVSCVKDLESFYLKNNTPALNSLNSLNWGSGYWVKVTNNCDLIWQMP